MTENDSMADIESKNEKKKTDVTIREKELFALNTTGWTSERFEPSAIRYRSLVEPRTEIKDKWKEYLFPMVKEIVRDELNKEFRGFSLTDSTTLPSYGFALTSQPFMSAQAGLELDMDTMLSSELETLTSQNKNPNLLLQQAIIDSNKDILSTCKGNYVAMTYEGKIISSSTKKVDLLKKVQRLKLPHNQIFIYSVPLK